MAEYIRESALQSKVVQPCTEADIKEYRTLVGMANNLNQLTKMAHQDGIIYLYWRDYQYHQRVQTRH